MGARLCCAVTVTVPWSTYSLQAVAGGWKAGFHFLLQLDGVYKSDFLVPIFESMELTITDIRCKYF